MASPPATESPLALLRRACDDVVEALGARGCTLSRLIGDLLVEVAEDAAWPGRRGLSRGFLVSDYPSTEAVLLNRDPLALSLADDAVDPAEAAVLEEVGCESLLMLPFESGGEVWGLVEVYGTDGRRFDAEDAERAAEIVRAAGSALERLRAV